MTGLFEAWIVFRFDSRVSLSRITLHYYCTGTPPQLQLVYASGIATSTMTPSCGDAAHRQSLTFNIPVIHLVIVLGMKRKGGYFYLTEVQFFNDAIPDPGTDIYTGMNIHHNYCNGNGFKFQVEPNIVMTTWLLV